MHLILKCLQFSVWNSRRVKGQQCLRSCPLQLINTHSHTHYNNNSNNNFKYACCCLCLSSCIIRSNSIQRRRRKSRMRRGGEWREVPVKRNCHSLHLPPQFRILCAIQSVAHICQSSAGSLATEKERGRTKDARGIAGLAPLSVAQLHFILRVSLQQRTT